MLVDEKTMALVGLAILLVLFLFICMSGGIVIYFTGHFSSVLHEHKDEEKKQENKKELRRNLILFLTFIIFYGCVSLALLIIFYKVSNYFW